MCNPLYLFAAIVRRVGWWHAPLVFDAVRKMFTPPRVSFPDFGDDVLLADGLRVKSRLSSLCWQSHDTMSFPQRYEAQGNMSGGVSRGHHSLCMCLICSNIAGLLQGTAIAPAPIHGLTNTRGRGVLLMEWEVEK